MIAMKDQSCYLDNDQDAGVLLDDNGVKHDQNGIEIDDEAE